MGGQGTRFTYTHNRHENSSVSSPCLFLSITFSIRFDFILRPRLLRRLLCACFDVYSGYLGGCGGYTERGMCHAQHHVRSGCATPLYPTFTTLIAWHGRVSLHRFVTSSAVSIPASRSGVVHSFLPTPCASPPRLDPVPLRTASSARTNGQQHVNPVDFLLGLVVKARDGEARRQCRFAIRLLD